MKFGCPCWGTETLHTTSGIETWPEIDELADSNEALREAVPTGTADYAKYGPRG